MSRVSNGSFALLAGAMATLLGFDGYALHRIGELSAESARLQQAVATDLANLRQLSAAVNDDQHEDLEGLVAGLAQARAEAATAVGEAQRAAERYVARLTRLVSRARHKRLVRTDQELASLRALAVAANATADTLRRQVDEASADAAIHKAQAAGARDAATIAAQTLEVLRTGVARNLDELATLRASGESVYIEFRLSRPGQQADMGGFRVMLKRLRPKAHRCTIEILAKRGHFVLQERGLQELVRFYPPGMSHAHELVVTEAGQTGIRGYVVVPRVAALANGRYSSGSAETRSLTPAR
jgi:hypothetical protein